MKGKSRIVKYRGKNMSEYRSRESNKKERRKRIAPGKTPKGAQVAPQRSPILPVGKSPKIRY